MEVDLAVLADAANTTQNGKLNVLGVFDTLNLGPDFPAASPMFSLVVRIVTHPSELGKHEFAIRLADADGREVAKLEGGFNVSRKKASPKPAKVQLILPSQIRFPGPGEYVFDILLDGRWERSIPIEVVKASG